MIMPCMNSTSGLDGAFGASVAVAAAVDKVLFAEPGAPGCTIAGAGPDEGTGCCEKAAVAHAASTIAIPDRNDGYTREDNIPPIPWKTTTTP